MTFSGRIAMEQLVLPTSAPDVRALRETSGLIGRDLALKYRTTFYPQVGNLGEALALLENYDA
jgi:hypothetical protein